MSHGEVVDTSAESVEAYVAAQNPAAQAFLTELRERVARQVPEVGEGISYKILAFSGGGRVLFYAAGWARHVSCYPVPESDPELIKDLQPYVSGQSTIKFSLAKPIPWELVDRVIAAASRR